MTTLEFNATITFLKLQMINSEKRTSHLISRLLKGDKWWEDLSNVQHQEIGKYLAKHSVSISNDYDINPKFIFAETDSYGNGIYEKV